MNSTCPFSTIADRIFVITCTRYQERRKLVADELSRIGADDVEFVTQFPNPFESRLLNIGVLYSNIWFGHYRALKIGYELGLSKMLIVEDDIIFLKDVDAIVRQLSNLRDGYSMVHLDPVVMNTSLYQDGISEATRSGMPGWGIYHGQGSKWLHSGGCYGLTRESMKCLIDIYESSACKTPCRAQAVDMIYNELATATGKPVFYAAPNIAVQRNFSNNQRGKYTIFAQNTYASMGLSLDRYGV